MSPLSFNPPPKICPSCGQEIPSSGFGRKMRLICEPCARAAQAPEPRKVRRRPGEKIEGQESFLESVPTIRIL